MPAKLGLKSLLESHVSAVAQKVPGTAPTTTILDVVGMKPIMGVDVKFETAAGRVVSVEDISYERRWQEHAGTDHHWAVRGNAAGQVGRSDLYVHHYVERNETVGRNKITVKAGKAGRESIYYLGSDKKFVAGDEVFVVVAGYDEVLLVNKSRDIKILSDRDIYLDPAPAGTADSIGRFLSGRGRTLGTLVLSLAAGSIIGLPFHAPVGCAISVAFVMAMTWLATVPQWRTRCGDFQVQVRATAIEAVKQLQLVRDGMSVAKAQEAAFGHHGGKTLSRGGKPLWMVIAERFGAKAIPPANSDEARSIRLAELQAELRRLRSGEVLTSVRTKFDELVKASTKQATDERLALRAAGGMETPAQSREILDRHRKRIEKFEHLRPRPPRHMRSKGMDPDRWELQWGPPKWPKDFIHLDV